MKTTIKLTLDLLVAYLGEPEKQSGYEFMWQCPYCRDTGRDNLKFKSLNSTLWCYANENHSPQILKDIIASNRDKNFSIPTVSNNDKHERYKRFFTVQKQVEFRVNMKSWNEALLRSSVYLTSIRKKRGISMLTVKKVKLGIDLNKKRWAIPNFQYSTEHSKIILGFEYRPLNLGKEGLTREKGAPTGLCMINAYTPQMEILVIVEGYFDGYALFQYLNEKGVVKHYHIVTPSNGVQSLLKHISLVDFDKYKKYYLYIDNDSAGNAKANEILEKYPMFERVTTTCGCKDFNEHYLKCIKALPTKQN